MNIIDWMMKDGSVSRYQAWSFVISIGGLIIILAILLRIVWEMQHN